MKKYLLFLLFVLVGFNSYSQIITLDNAIQTASRQLETYLPRGSKVAVLNFISSSEQFSNYVIEELMDTLTNGKSLGVVERQRLNIIRREMELQMSGEVSDESMQSIGKLLGAQSIITGSLTDIGTTYRFRVYAINVETGLREASSTSNLSIKDTQVTFLLTGQRQAPSSSLGVFRQRGKVTWGISSGQLEIGHPTLPVGSVMLLTNEVNGLQVVVKVTKRIGFSTERIAEISTGVETALGLSTNDIVLLESQPR